jgi:hypothetical protein
MGEQVGGEEDQGGWRHCGVGGMNEQILVR